MHRIGSSYSVARLRLNTFDDLVDRTSSLSPSGSYCVPNDAATVRVTCDQQDDTYSTCKMGKLKAESLRFSFANFGL